MRHPDSDGAPAAKPTPQRRSAVDTRARILKKAVAEFAAQGFGGARIDAIAKAAQTNIRMLYHYFGSKEQLYLAVLESVINDLRLEELKLDFSAQEDALAGLLQMFDFIDHHFSRHAELRNILSGENLNRARYMKKSKLIPTMSSPVLSVLQALIRKGQAAGAIRLKVDALHLYVTMVSLVSYHKTNAYTFSTIFGEDLTGETWQAEQRRFNRSLLETYLRAPAVESAAPPDAAKRSGVTPSGAKNSRTTKSVITKSGIKKSGNTTRKRD